ncbi:MAG TPA: DegT/DnrJ/EryC1/StrS family aminotransferase [Terriglobia bacterium]|nr:DegT/DnrJ/EryC1/StrS family aminotransferase [Terriglobia bacterium]
MRIPFLDLSSPHIEMEEELIEVFRSALRSGSFVGGPMVEDFEQAFAAFCGTRFAVGVGSGTDALRFAVMAAGIGSGQIAITVPNTFTATAEAITQSGARVDFVDIDARTYNMDPAKLEQYLSTKCRWDDASGTLIHVELGIPVTAVVPVHLYGQPADMDAILEIATKYNLTVIEDACQAHGAEYYSEKQGRWLKAGSMGRAAAFSFYPGKNLGACGEAGAVTTNDEMIAKKIRMLRDHGQARKYHHEMEGYNGRLDAIQAGILLHKLKRLPEWTEQRREKAACYGELLAGCEELVVPFEPACAKGVYHLYVVRTEAREDLIRHLSGAGIGTGIHYPIPLHLQKCYKHLGYKQGNFPVSEKASREVLSLPMFPGLRLEEQEKVVHQIRHFPAATPQGRPDRLVPAPVA